MRTKKLIAATAVAALCLLPVASAANAAQGMEVGLQDDPVFTRAYYNIHKAITQAQQLHVTRLRVFVIWADVGGAAASSRKKPKKVKYNFSAFDNLLSFTNPAHIPVQMVLTGPAPAWASGNHRKSADTPNSKYFGDFAKQAAAHFKGRIDRYSIWNEPNYISWLAPQKKAPAIYRSLYVAGYNAIKSQDPAAKVLIGETSPYAEGRNAIAPLAFLRGVLGVNGHWTLKKGAKGLKTDGVAHHPYEFRHSPSYTYKGADNVTMGTLGRLTRALGRAQATGALTTPDGSTPYVYLSEYGYLSSGKKKINDRAHAAYLAQAFGIAVKNSRVKQLVQYGLVPPRGRYAFFDMSIVDKNGKPRKPFTSLQKWANGAAKKNAISVIQY